MHACRRRRNSSPVLVFLSCPGVLRLPFLVPSNECVFRKRERRNCFAFSVLSGILTPKTDTCLTARTALTLIATSRSNMVIITLARELAKHALVQSGTTSSTLPGTIKNEQKNEILRLMKILIEKCPHDVAELILEVGNERRRSIDHSSCNSRWQI